MQKTGVKTERRFFDRLVTTLFLSLITCSSALFAQINSGGIAGFVSDPSGASVADATVVATNIATQVVARAVTLQNGNYLLNYLVPGTYKVQVNKPGFATSVETHVEVTAGIPRALMSS